MTTTYSNATITLDGKALDLADLSTAERCPSIDFAQPLAASLAFKAAMPAAPDLGRLLRGAQSPAMVDMHLPAGILGHVVVRGFVAGTTTRGDAAGTTVEMGVDVRDNAIRRALSMAVQRAIVSAYERDRVALRALEHDDPKVRGMARSLAGDAETYRRPGGLYRHGDRKWRRAMRRLLRAAGVTYSPG